MTPRGTTSPTLPVTAARPARRDRVAPRPSGPRAPASTPGDHPAARPGVRHLVEEGAHVTAGQPLVVTETMKCEQTLVAAIDGTVAFPCSVGAVVEPGDVSPRSPPSAAPSPPPAGAAARARCPRRPWSTWSAARTPTPAWVPRRAAAPSWSTTSSRPPAMFATPSPATPWSHRRPRVRRRPRAQLRRDGRRDDPRRRRPTPTASPGCGSAATRPSMGRRRRGRVPADPGRDSTWPSGSTYPWSGWRSRRCPDRLGLRHENMDWCAAVVARLVTFTQAGGQVVWSWSQRDQRRPRSPTGTPRPRCSATTAACS